MSRILLFVFFYLNILNIKCSAKSPVIIAHRGASGYLPEHTLESKVAAFFMHSDYIEQDVVLTRDNIPIVLHDLYLDGVTDVAYKYPNRKRPDSRYYAIDFDLEEIRNLDVSERFDHKNPSKAIYQYRFPLRKSKFKLNTLAEEIELIQGLDGSLKRISSLYNIEKTNYKNMGIYVELKNPEFHKKENKGNFSEIVLNILKDYNYTKRSDNVIIQCFDPIETERIRKKLKSDLKLVQLLEPDQKTGDFDWTSLKGLERIKTYADGVGPYRDMLVKYDDEEKLVEPSEFYENSRKLDLFLHPWTFRVDSLPWYAKSYQELLKIFIIDLKVDGLFTDFPDVTADFVKQYQINSNIRIKYSSSLIFMAIMIYLIHFLKF